VQCWRKSRESGVETGPEPHCSYWASHEVRKKLLWYDKRRSQCVTSWAKVQPGPCVILWHECNDTEIKILPDFKL